MRQSRSLNCSKNNSKVSLDDFILFCINDSIKTAYNGGNLWDVDKKISKIYGFEEEAAVRMYSPAFNYLACLDKKRKLLIECECSLRETVWHATEKAKNLSEKEKEKIRDEIKEENIEYFKAIIQQFNLNILP